MNSATLKWNKIISNQGKFRGLVSTVQEDIVSMFTKRTIQNKWKWEDDSGDRPSKQKQEDDSNERNSKGRKAYEKPLFYKQTQEMKNGVNTYHTISDKTYSKERNITSVIAQIIGTPCTGIHTKLHSAGSINSVSTNSHHRANLWCISQTMLTQTNPRRQKVPTEHHPRPTVHANPSRCSSHRLWIW